MSFARVKLHNLGVSRERNEVPVFSSEALQLYYGTETQYSTRVFEKVKVRRSLEPQAIELPISDLTSLLDCDVCSFAYYYYNGSEDMSINEQDLQWFYITGYEEITYKGVPPSSADMNVRLYLEPIPVTSYMTQATKFDILPERMPSATAHVRQNWTQSIMQDSAPTTPIPALPKLPKVKINGEMKQVFFASVTFTNSNGSLLNANWFVAMSAYPLHGDVDDGAKDVIYPTFIETLRSPLVNVLHISDSPVIQDVAISEFCPYEVTVGTVDADNEYINVTGKSFYYTYSAADKHVAYSEIPGGRNISDTQSITVTLTDFEKENGQIVLRDGFKNNVMTIPAEKNASTMTFTFTTYIDSSNIYTMISCGSYRTILPGYKIPWTTSSWEQYKAFSLQYDRQALQNNIDMADEEMKTAMLNGVVNGIIGGAISGSMQGGVTGAGLGLATGVSSVIGTGISASINRDISVRKMQMEQSLTEQRMKGGPTNANNIGSGWGIADIVEEYGGVELVLLMPAGFTETEWTAQTAIWGYPSNKILTAEQVFSAGYWKGRVMAFQGLINNANSGDNGIQMDRIVSQIEEGIRVKIISS